MTPATTGRDLRDQETLIDLRASLHVDVLLKP